MMVLAKGTVLGKFVWKTAKSLNQVLQEKDQKETKGKRYQQFSQEAKWNDAK